MKLSTYLSAKRGRIVAVARKVGLAPAFLSQMAHGTRPVPAEHCAALERATEGAVRRWDLRPADWDRIWPELAHLEEAPPAPAAAAAPARPRG
jgi:DNA-binding transcriptional regulator YdaS (Cro superfamily)